jgi:hypothetical protein
MISLMTHASQPRAWLGVLRGLIPVCAFCKKIRTEDQKWQPIEIYITQHSEATFTSTFYPECAAQHYGPYYERLKQA